MNFTVILEVAIGIIFIWVLLSLIASAIQEWISQWLKWRPAMLEEAIRNILADNELEDTPTQGEKEPTLTQKFYDHPLIKSLHSNGGDRRPSAIPSKQFASVVFDLILNAGTEDSKSKKAKSVIDQIRKNVGRLKTNEGNKLQKLAGAVDTLLIDISDDVKKADTAIADARTRVENWFDDAMVRLGGSYKRKTQVWLLIIGIMLAAAMNADSLMIANHLWKDPLAREALVAKAEQYQLPENQDNQDAQKAAKAYYDQLQSLSDELSVPLGWNQENMPEPTFWGWLAKIFGILLSGAAAAQGAPFWFDIMRKILNLRGGGGSSQSTEKKEEG